MPATCPPTPAAIVSRVDAEYPEMARVQHAEGTAIVKITIAATGKVANAAINKSAGNASLDSAAVQAAKSTGFKAATDECKPVSSVYLMVVDMHE